MKRRFFLILLAACLGLSACQAQDQPGRSVQSDKEPVSSDEQSAAATTEPTESGTTVPELPEGEGLGLNSLDNRLIAYLRSNGLAQKSFAVSPLSFKAALAMTALGAEGETQRQILDVLGFQTVEAMTDWYASVLVGAADFESRCAGMSGCAYRIVNAIFHNANCDGEFRERYKELAARTLAAHADSCAASEITKVINDWVNQQTNGLIPAIVDDASKTAAVLVNALYLKTKWEEPFADSPITDFTTVSGQTVQKQFITKSEKYRYYADGDCQLVVLPLQGGINLVMLLGDGANLSEKLENATYQKVNVTFPKFEVESSFCQKELVNCLKAIGCEKMFLDSIAEFDPMFTEGIFVDDIIQKAKVKVDENGLEAAAATAVVIMRNTALPNPEKPIDFIADRPFQFCILREDATPELLFWGQIME